MPKISIIIPSYNAEKYVEQCIGSIKKQTFTDFEVIVIDDGSTDQSAVLWDKFTDEDDRFRIFHQNNQGQAVSRNNAITKARGEFITFLDADDTLEPTMLEEMYEAAKDKKAELVWCELFRVENGIKTPISPLFMEQNDDKKDFILNNAGPVAKLIKKDIIIKNKLFFLENRIYEDIAVVPAYALYTNSIAHIRKPLYNYMIYKGSTMHQIKYNKKMEDIFYAMECVNNYFQDKFCDEIECLYIYHLLHGASLRFFKFQEGKSSLTKIVNIMHQKYPNWSNNCYYKNSDVKFRIVCRLFYKKHYRLLKLILK